MAEVVQSVSQRVDLLLNFLTEEWRRVPQVAREIDGWDLLDQLSFTEAWPSMDESLVDLEGYADRGVLTPTQQARFEKLKHLIAENEPILRQILES